MKVDDLTSVAAGWVEMVESLGVFILIGTSVRDASGQEDC